MFFWQAASASTVRTTFTIPDPVSHVKTHFLALLGHIALLLVQQWSPSSAIWRSVAEPKRTILEFPTCPLHIERRFAFA
jgi:hypothetical protein